MSTIALAIAAAAEVVVERPGPIWWRVSMADSATVRLAVAARLQLDAQRARAAEAGAQPGAEAEPDAAMMARYDRLEMEVLAAGVRAVTRESAIGPWETITMVATPAQAAPEAGRIFAGALNRATRAALFSEIWTLTTDEGAAAARIARFLGG